MKLIDCINAYMAVLELSLLEWDFKTAHTFAMLKRTLAPHAQFYATEEKSLISDFAKKDENGNIVFTNKGSFLFDSLNDAPRYSEKRHELGDVEVTLHWEKVSLPRPERIKPVHIEALEPFVAFGGEENEL